jgi:hypothetical protein
MYCSSCGSQIALNAVICPKCGVATSNFNVNNKNIATAGYVVASYIASFILPIVGVILGIYLLCKGRPGHGLGSLVLSIFMWAFWFGLISYINNTTTNTP